MGSYQLDPWWSDGLGDEPNWYWAPNWTAVPKFFPSGLEKLGLPLVLYSNMFAVGSDNVMAQFPWINSTSCVQGCYAIVPSNVSYAFFSYIFDLSLAWGAVGFEMDFQNWQFLSFAHFLTSVSEYDRYYQGMSDAAYERELPVQLCMDLPAMVLASVDWDAVTNARLAGDGFPQNPSRWDIQQTSLLLAALDVAPFLDVVWTTSCQPGWDNPYGRTVCEANVDLLVAVATLSAGPVGFGDGLGFTNASLLKSTCRSDGVLLQPSRPVVLLDVCYDSASLPGPESRVASAPVFLAQSPAMPPPPHYPYPSAVPVWHSVQAINIGSPWTLLPQYLSPPADASDVFVATTRSRGAQRTASECAHGATASRCASLFAQSAPLSVLTSVSSPDQTLSHDVYSIAPVLGGFWALLGDLSKIVPVSPARFSFVSLAHNGDLSLGVTGGPFETLSITLLAGLNTTGPDLARGAVLSVAVNLSGAGSSVIHCFKANPNCYSISDD